MIQEAELRLEGAEEGVGKRDGELLTNTSHHSVEILAPFREIHVYILSILTFRQCVHYVFAVNPHFFKELVTYLIGSHHFPEIRDCLSARDRDYLFPSKGTSPLGLFDFGALVPRLLSLGQEIFKVNVSTNLVGDQMVATELECVTILGDFQPFILRSAHPSCDFASYSWVEVLAILLGLVAVVPREFTFNLEWFGTITQGFLALLHLFFRLFLAIGGRFGCHVEF